MRETQIGASEGLQHCLVEEGGASLRSSGRRRLSFVVSVALQAAALTAALAVPLLVNGEKLQPTIYLTPQVPFHGLPDADPRPEASGTSRGTPGRDVAPTPNFQLPTIPNTVAETNDSITAPEQLSSGFSPGRGLPDGLVPGSGESLRSAPMPPLPVKPTEPESQRLVVHKDVQAARLIHRVDPVYTPVLRSIRAQGTVRLRAIIARDGTVRELEVLSVTGHPLFARQALDAIQQWRYRPTLLNGQPVEVETQITVVFTLR